MKKHPILFSGELVRAILEGRKTQTRRIVNPQFGKDDLVRECCKIIKPEGWQGTGHSGLWAHEGDYEMRPRKALCVPGDRLWVRETFRLSTKDDCACDGICQCKVGIPFYRADDSDQESVVWKPSIHMPRWASRITLEVTEVRVQRLQEVGEDDAKAEGCDGNCPIGYIPARQQGPCVYQFAQLWDSIYSKTHPWESNPWVWAYTFKRIQ